MESTFLFDFANITLPGLRASNITESGTYYVALVSFGLTYKNIGSAEFSPVLASVEDTDLISFKGFEWANSNKNNNTLYAVLDVKTPEPSTYAALMGALAICFALIYRKFN